MRMMHLRADTSSTLPSARSRKKQLVHSSNFWWSRTCTARTPAPSCARARAPPPSAQARARGACGGCACGARAAADQGRPLGRCPCAPARAAEARRVPGGAWPAGAQLASHATGTCITRRAGGLAGCCWTREACACCISRTHAARARPCAPGGHGSSKQALAGGWGRAFWAGVSWPALISSSTMWCSYCARASAAAVRSRACLEALAGRSALPARARARAGARPSGAGCQHRGTRRARHVAPGARGAPRSGPGRALGYG